MATFNFVDQYDDCYWLQDSLMGDKQLESNHSVMLPAMEFVFALADLLVKAEEPEPTAVGAHAIELAEKKEKVRTHFARLVETEEPDFIDCLFETLDLPEDFCHSFNLANGKGGPYV